MDRQTIIFVVLSGCILLNLILTGCLGVQTYITTSKIKDDVRDLQEVVACMVMKDLEKRHPSKDLYLQ